MMDLHYIFILLSIMLVGFFAGVEMAFYHANKLSIEIGRKQGRKSGQILSFFLENPSHLLGTTLVGINFFLVFYALITVDAIDGLWNWVGLNSYLRILINIFLATAVLLIGDFVVRVAFRKNGNRLLVFFAPLVNFFHDIFFGVARFLNDLAKWILNVMFDIHVNEKKETFSRVDLENFLYQTREKDEEVAELNTELLENALSLPSVKVRQCLVPRKEIEAISIHASVNELKQKFIHTKLSKLVVYEGSIDHIVGYVHQLDLFKNPTDIRSILLPIPVVPESMSATDLIGKFTRERKSIAWVVDEFGGTAGIITMEDLLEELFGEIKDEYDTEEFVEKQIAENEFIFSGRLELDYLNEKYHLEFPANDSETLSGYVINFHESIPSREERIIIDHYQFDILQVSDTRIEMLKMKVLS
jgi:CBS domain containing-hemolysin-like protein